MLKIGRRLRRQPSRIGDRTLLSDERPGGLIGLAQVTVTSTANTVRALTVVSAAATTLWLVPVDAKVGQLQVRRCGDSAAAVALQDDAVQR